MKVTIIGGAGKMGKWFINYFLKSGHEVTISDKRREDAKAISQSMNVRLARSNIEAVKDAEIIVVSTPINVTPKVLGEISEKIPKLATVIEISSLKSQVMFELRKIAMKGVKTLSIHPLFGPGTAEAFEEKIALVPVSNPDYELKLAKNVFPKAKLVVVDVEEHDKAMALTLSLPHFMNIVFASVIGQEDINALKKLGGPTFTIQLALSEGVMSEDPLLYSSIQIDNRFTVQILERFISNANTLKQHITEKKSTDFLQFFGNTQSLLLKDSEFCEAYERMYKILEVFKEERKPKSDW
ncbi:MAG: prephenate dehydrogenase/arogenate dehydrogenase family protein [Candidatus Bathyarchaeia archaeon]|nr:prephenate dehydrogenase/arogenate dehydrogenase family protein [Candidatus Bathyarchaeota archaeon]